MSRKFITTHVFDVRWEALGFDDEDLRTLQNMLLANPKLGDVMQGTGGARKMRFAFEDRGKSGSIRVLYVDVEVKEIIVLLTVFAKAKQGNLKDDEKEAYRKKLRFIKKEVQ